MGKYKKQLRHTLNPDYDLTTPDRSLTVLDDDRQDLFDAIDEHNAKGLEGALDELEAECIEYLANNGIGVRDIDRDHPKYIAHLMNALIPKANTDPYTNEVCSLFLGIVLAKADLSSPAETVEEKNRFAFRMFQLGAGAEAAKLATVRKFAATGEKIRIGLDKGNRSELRKQIKAQRHQRIVSDAQALRKRSRADSEIAGMLAKRYKSEGFSPASYSHIHTVLKKSDFY